MHTQARRLPFRRVLPEGGRRLIASSGPGRVQIPFHERDTTPSLGSSAAIPMRTRVLWRNIFRKNEKVLVQRPCEESRAQADLTRRHHKTPAEVKSKLRSVRASTPHIAVPCSERSFRAQPARFRLDFGFSLRTRGANPFFWCLPSSANARPRVKFGASAGVLDAPARRTADGH